MHDRSLSSTSSFDNILGINIAELRLSQHYIAGAFPSSHCLLITLLTTSLKALIYVYPVLPPRARASARVPAPLPCSVLSEIRTRFYLLEAVSVIVAGTERRHTHHPTCLPHGRC